MKQILVKIADEVIEDVESFHLVSNIVGHMPNKGEFITQIIWQAIDKGATEILINPKKRS